jgi:hypothetical protein
MISRGSMIGIACLCLGGLGLGWILSKTEITLNPEPTSWTPTGAKAEYQISIWIDPVTKCQYYTNVSFSVNLTRRDGPDGLPICNQPTPEGVKVNSK